MQFCKILKTKWWSFILLKDFFFKVVTYKLLNSRNDFTLTVGTKSGNDKHVVGTAESFFFSFG